MHTPLFLVTGQVGLVVAGGLDSEFKHFRCRIVALVVGRDHGLKFPGNPLFFPKLFCHLAPSRRQAKRGVRPLFGVNP